MISSLRGAARMILRSPALTLGIVLSFALGIGANAVMFEVVDRLLLSPPAYVAGADQVKRLMVDRIVPETKTRGTTDVMSYPDYVVVLLVGAVLFVHGLNKANSVHLGFDPTGLLVVSPEFDHDTGAADAVRDAEFTRRALARLRGLPGVEHVSGDISTPLESAFSVNLKVPGLDSMPVLPSGPPVVHTVGPDYFNMMHLRILRGRGLRPEDNRIGAAHAVVVNTLMARMLWPGRDASGQCLVVYDGDANKSVQPPCATVVGVADAAALESVANPAPIQFYVPAEAGIVTARAPDILVRASDDGEQLVPVIREALVDLDPSVRFFHIDSLREAVDRQTSSWRFGAKTFTAFGMLALIVAGIGLYSVLAFSVAQRTFEIGVRTALGATPRRLATMVLVEPTIALRSE